MSSHLRCKVRSCIAMTLLAFVCCVQGAPRESHVTLIMMGDLHGTLLPHAAVFKNPDNTDRYSADAGGLAKLKTVVDRIRADSTNSLLLSVGDLTHGSAETLFTVGDAIMPAINAFGIDAFTPGNWDFGYGPSVFRKRFSTKPPQPPLPENIRVMAAVFDGPGVTRAAFPALALNAYNAPPLPQPLLGRRVLEPYRIFDVDGLKIAVIGITAAIVAQQADVFNVSFRFTHGVTELPAVIAEVQSAGANLIVVQSELGLAQNIALARRFRDIDVMYSAHTHEITLGALVADADAVTRTTPGQSFAGRDLERLQAGAGIVVETDRDLHVGRLDLTVAGGRLTAVSWQAIPVDDSVEPDADMAALVAAAEEDFVAGADAIVKRHTFVPGGFCADKDCGDTTERGLQLNDDLDAVVGESEILLIRRNVLEDPLNNLIADAIRAVTDPVVASAGINGWAGVDVAMTNGFRFGSTVLPGNPIRLRDLYTWFPLAPALVVAEFSGQAIERSLDDVLGAVFDRDPFRQRGGWYLGLSNITQKIDLDHRPATSSGTRIVETTIGGAMLDPAARYVFASCYAHGDPLDNVCRTGGGAGHMFFELTDADDYASEIMLVAPVNRKGILRGATIKQVAPDRFLHAVHILRRHLNAVGTVTQASYAAGRIQTVDSLRPGNPEVSPPVAEPDRTFVQPPQGAGPALSPGHSNF